MDLFAHDLLLQRVERQKGETQMNETRMHNDGLLIRIKALFNLVLNDWVMALIYGLFTLFIFSMELLAVLMKSGWRKTNYERKLEMMEEIGRKRMEKLLDHYASYDSAMNIPEVLKAKRQVLDKGKLSVFN